MATVNLTSVITSSGLTSDTISSTILKSNNAITQGGITRTTIASTTSAVLLAHASHAEGTYVYLKNAGSTYTLRFKYEGGADSIYQLELQPGDWAVFPWSAAVDLKVFSNNATGSVLEYAAFQ